MLSWHMHMICWPHALLATCSVLVMSGSYVTDPVILDDSYSDEELSDDSKPRGVIVYSKSYVPDSPIVLSDDSDLDDYLTNNIPTILPDSPVKVVKSKRCRLAKTDNNVYT